MYQKMNGQPMPWQEAARLLIPIARALNYAHKRNLIHRDIKPSNILITESGEPMLTDFGVAKIIDEEATLDLTGTSAAVGTPEYMAPEQATSKNVDHRADIYALGIVFYEMVTGRRPFQADTPLAVLFKQASEPLPRPSQFITSLPDSVEKILLKALTKKPEDRYQGMGEVVHAMESLVSGVAPAVKQQPAPAKPQPASPREKTRDPLATVDQTDTRATINQDEETTVDDTPVAGVQKPATKTVKKPAPSGILRYWPVAAGAVFVVCILLVVVILPLVQGSGQPTAAPPNEAPVITKPPIATESPVMATELPLAATEPPMSSIGSPEHPIKVLFVPSTDVNVIATGGDILVAALIETTGLTFEVVVPTSYAATIEEMCASPTDTMAFIPGLGYAIASQLCGVNVAFKAVRYGYPVYWAEYIVARDSEYQTLADLEGATWGYGDQGSAPGYMVPTVEFAAAGITPGEQVQTGGHSQTVTAVYNGEVDFGTVFYSVPLTPEGKPVFSYDDYLAGKVTPDMYELPAEVIPNCAPDAEGKKLLCDGWRVLDARANIRTEAPDVMQKVRILAISQAVPNDALAFGPEFPANLRAQVEEALVAFAGTEAWGTSIGDFYGWTGITPATDAEYDIVRAMVESTGYSVEP